MPGGKDRDPSTLAGQFPSELGSGRSGPIELRESLSISKGVTLARNGYGALVIDNRRIGGTMDGIYTHTTDYPFEGATTTYVAQTTGTYATSIDDTATITGSPILGPQMEVSVSLGTTTVSFVNFNFSVTNFDNGLFDTTMDGDIMSMNFQSLNIPTGEDLSLLFNAPLAVPAAYYAYRYLEGANDIYGRRNFGILPAYVGRDIKRYVHPQSDTTFSFSASFRLYDANYIPATANNFTAIAHFATASPDLSSISYQTFG